MGIVGCFAAVNPAQLDALRKDPSGLEGFLYPEDDEGEPEHQLDVDKAWNGIHYLLTGTSNEGEGPLALAIKGGQEIGDDMGYGPARFLLPEEVQAVAQALERLTLEQLKKGFKPDAMTTGGVYPENIWTEEGEEALDYLLEHYQALVDFYRDASARGDGALLWLG